MQTTESHASGRSDGVLLGDTHIEDPVREPLGKLAEANRVQHGSGYRNKPVVFLGKLNQFASKDFGP